MPDFWTGSGYRLLRVASDGRLALTDDFLRSFLARPELAPIAQSCEAERSLHEALLGSPSRPIDDAEIAAIEDADARENYAIFRRFRDRLLAAESMEAAYVALFRSDVDVPPAFVDQLTQILLRHILGERADPIEARAAEMLFRVQKIAVLKDGAVMAADDATVELLATVGGFGSLGELLARPRTPVRSIDLDVLGKDNGQAYWSRDERFDWSIGLNRGSPGLDALCRVLERWIAHFLGVQVRIQPKREIDDARWVWHVGLDAQASGILNDLYNGIEVDETRLARLLCLFQLDFADPRDVLPAIAGRPVYLAMAIDADNRLRLKPQNLLHNLPLPRQ